MTYGIGIGFPMEPTKEDIKKLKRKLARDMFGVVNGGKAGSTRPNPKPKASPWKPVSGRLGRSFSRVFYNTVVAGFNAPIKWL
jgi:hypothetical protein